MNWRAPWAAGVGVTLAVSIFGAACAGLADARGTPAPVTDGEPVHLLDVPYVPQTSALCGGAAVAMVLRYWGDPTARAEDFTAQLSPSGDGIRADSLVSAVRARGWTALPIAGTPSAVEAQLALGRPVIALLRVAPATYHYVVLLAWANGGVILHDPAVAPFRTSNARAFDAAWAGSGRWALLVLPRQGAPAGLSATALPASPASPALPPASPPAPPVLAGCDAIVEDAIQRAHDGDADGAERRMLSAAALCPASAAPLRGLAGLRFAAHDWAGAARLAERALAIDSTDAYTWRLLAGSRFLLADEVGALRAWNRVSEPRTDLARVDGLVRIRYRTVAGQVGLPAGRVLTAGAFVCARRRLAEIPAQSTARLALRPLPAGSAQLDVSVLERPLLFGGPLDAGGAALRALLTREASLRVASPLGYGELWTLGARWREARPRAELLLAIPAGAGRPGIWHVEGSWERQSYALAAGVQREERKRSAIAWSDWVAPNLRLEMGTALDRWSGRGANLALESALELRGADDRLLLAARAAQWTSLAHAAPFRAGSLAVRWGPRSSADAGWRARAEVFHAGAQAPLALWPGAGTGSGREALLRAQPLLTDGVVTGRAFGRSLVDLGVEREQWARRIASVRLGFSVFVDAARAWDALPGAAGTGTAPWLVDGGASLRVAAPGARGAFRVTGAHGFSDGKAALSFSWESR